MPDLSDAFFANCAHTVQQVARKYGYMTLVVSSERDADLEFQEAELMAGRKVSGLLIVTSTRKGDDRLRGLQSTGLAIVAFDRPLPSADIDSVLVEAGKVLKKPPSISLSTVNPGSPAWAMTKRPTQFMSALTDIASRWLLLTSTRRCSWPPLARWRS